MIRDSLASPTLSGGGTSEERGDEEHETESRGHLHGTGGIGRRYGDKTLTELSDPFRVHLTQITEGKPPGWRDQSDVGDAGSQDPSC